MEGAGQFQLKNQLRKIIFWKMLKFINLLDLEIIIHKLTQYLNESLIFNRMDFLIAEKWFKPLRIRD